MKSQYVNIHLKICLAYLCFALVFLQSLLALTPNYFNTGKRMRVVSHRFFSAIRLSYGEKGTASWMPCGTSEVKHAAWPYNCF